MSQFPAVEFIKSVAAPGQFPPDVGWELAVAGRSNSGKSSAINALLGRKGLARTSRTPGRTQLYNYFTLAEGKRLVDLPGYGHASLHYSKRENWGPLGDELRERASFGALLLIVDIRRGVGDMDLGLLEWADQPPEFTHVLLSKADKLPRGQAMQALRDAEAALAGLASCQLFSALKGTGLEEGRGLLRRWIKTAKEITPAD
ncbi:MAG: ribosome biogenesis GTP-binding protein YihA/YsxC [Steroidobacteraceae bacterium]